ncbi:hypothetical protein [Pedobacter jeongneungensis]|uniref:hypothetical protein n=1 Tax=Pedobacter jeongneungensis TaxID=947309 RepID=UPI000468BE1F|nr:hypothetical protein [Pedobacter jeongneungensis]
MWYTIDINKLVILLIPTFLRKPVFIAWLQALATPITTLHQQWYNKRLDNLYKLAHNGQVCYLRAALNDAFDPGQRRIKITNGNKYQRKYIYTSAEQKQKYLGLSYLLQVGDYADTGVDFRVVIPQDFDLVNNIYQLKAMIDFYKLAGKRYNIEKE